MTRTESNPRPLLVATALAAALVFASQPPVSADPQPKRTDNQATDRRPHRPGRPADAARPTDRVKGKHHRPMTLEQRIDFVKTIDPELAEKLSEGLGRSRPRVERMMQEQWPRFENLAKLSRTDPKLFSMRVKDFRYYRGIMMAAGQYRVATRTNKKEDADRAKTRLRGLIAERFKLRQEIRELEIERMSKRLDQMRKQLENEQAKSDQLIQGQLDHALRAGGRPLGQKLGPGKKTKTDKP